MDPSAREVSPGRAASSTTGRAGEVSSAASSARRLAPRRAAAKVAHHDRERFDRAVFAAPQLGHGRLVAASQTSW